MKYYLISLLFLLASCNGQKKVGMKNPSAQSKADTPLVLLLQDEYGGFDVAETMIIKDQKRLKAFYSKINMTRKPGLSVPDIDFSKEMLVLQCSGAQSEIGVSTLIWQNETNTQVVLTSKLILDENQSRTAVTTYPFCLYKMPITEKEVVVQEIKK